MTDFALVAAGVVAAASQPASDVSALDTSELQTQEDELIAAVLRAPAAPVRARPIQPPLGVRPIAAQPRFSSSFDVKATNGRGSGARGGNDRAIAMQARREALQRAQVEARLRQLENSALAQMPGAVISFELPSVSAQPAFQPTASPLPSPHPASRLQQIAPQQIAPQITPIQRAPQQIAPQPTVPQQIAPIQRAPQQLIPRSRQTFAPPPVAFAPVSSTSAGIPYRYQAGGGRVGARVWNTRTSYSARW